MLTLIANSVFYQDCPPSAFFHDEISILHNHCSEKELPYARICFHLNSQSSLMSMLVFMLDKHLYPAHRHTWKDESYIIVKGNCNFLEFSSSGRIVHSQYLPEGSFYMNESRSFHTLQPLTSPLAFVEHTVGPFRDNKLEFLEHVIS